MHTHNRLRRGFSLVELMVSLTIFAIVMLVGIGTLLIVIDANAKAQALSSSMTNLSFALDSVTRNIRAGKNFHCTGSLNINSGILTGYASPNDCTGSNNNTALVFTPRANPTYRVAYQVYSDAIWQLVDRPGKTDSWIPITSNDGPGSVKIETMKFILENSDHTTSGNYEQPTLSLIIKGSVQNGLTSNTVFQVQSQVVQRLLDII